MRLLPILFNIVMAGHGIEFSPISLAASSLDARSNPMQAVGLLGFAPRKYAWLFPLVIETGPTSTETPRSTVSALP